MEPLINVIIVYSYYFMSMRICIIHLLTFNETKICFHGFIRIFISFFEQGNTRTVWRRYLGSDRGRTKEQITQHQKLYSNPITDPLRTNQAPLRTNIVTLKPPSTAYRAMFIKEPGSVYYLMLCELFSKCFEWKKGKCISFN